MDTGVVDCVERPVHIKDREGFAVHFCDDPVAQSVRLRHLTTLATVDARMMAAARPDALFMHCLPAHRGEEVAADVLESPQSVVWEEAENRLHVQKALMEYLLLGRVET